VAVESRISTAISSANDPLDDDIRRAIWCYQVTDSRN
jgi:hypothetical protein